MLGVILDDQSPGLKGAHLRYMQDENKKIMSVLVYLQCLYNCNNMYGLRPFKFALF
jgi:hypothetical protein